MFLPSNAENIQILFFIFVMPIIGMAVFHIFLQKNKNHTLKNILFALIKSLTPTLIAFFIGAYNVSNDRLDGSDILIVILPIISLISLIVISMKKLLPNIEPSLPSQKSSSSKFIFITAIFIFTLFLYFLFNIVAYQFNIKYKSGFDPCFNDGSASIDVECTINTYYPQLKEEYLKCQNMNNMDNDCFSQLEPKMMEISQKKNLRITQGLVSIYIGLSVIQSFFAVMLAKIFQQTLLKEKNVFIDTIG